MTDYSAENQDATVPTSDWQRLSPMSVIYFILRFIVGFARQGIQNLAIFGGILFATGNNRLGMIVFGISVALVVLLVASVLSYINFRFRVNRNAFLIHRGVLQKKRLTLSFDRIQNIAIKEPIYFRPFGLVTMALESAGSASEEVNLAGIDRRVAEELRKTVLARPTVAEPQVASASDTPSNEDGAGVLLHHNVGELVRYGLSNNNMWVFAGLAAGAISQVDDKVGKMINEWLKLPESYIASLDTVTATLVGIAALVALFAFMMLLSVIGAIVIYHDYRLSFEDGRFLRLKGLFERSETSLPERKVQALELKQPWPAILLRRRHATLLQVGFSNDWEEGNLNPKQSKFIIPSLTDENTAKLASHLYPDLDFGAIHFTGVNPMYLKRLFFVDWASPVALLSVSLSFLATPWFLFLNLLPFLILPFMWLNYRRLGYWSDGQYFAVRTGLIGHKLVLFPLHKAQSVKVTRTPGQRRRGLATLTIKLAGHKVKIPYVPDLVAKGARDHILRVIFASHTPWM